MHGEENKPIKKSIIRNGNNRTVGSNYNVQMPNSKEY